MPRIAACVLVVAIVVAAAACGDGNGDRLATTFAQQTFCPDERVHAKVLPELALVSARAVVASVAPWQEPVPPADIANDPERMQLWRTHRDADYAAWTEMRDRAEQASSLAEQARANPIYEVSGCGGAQLYTCNDRRRHPCNAIVAPSSATGFAHLACLDGGALHATRDAVLQCVPGEPTVDAPACLATCPAATACKAACRGADRDTCELRCTSAEAGCHLACAASARAECEGRGLATLGLCAGYAHEEELMHEAERQLGEVDTKLQVMTAMRTRVLGAQAAYQTCSSGCSGRTDSHAIVTCMLGCATAAREQCEAGEPNANASSCEGFRAAESGLQRQLGP